MESELPLEKGESVVETIHARFVRGKTIFFRRCDLHK